MNYAINGRYYRRRIAGVERYAQELTSRLDGQARLLTPPRPASGITGHLWEQVLLPRQLNSAEALWSPANTGPLAFQRQLLTIHDLSPLDHPEWFRPAFALWYRWLWPALARQVSAISAPSVFSKERLVNRLHIPSEKITIIPGGVGEQFRRTSEEDIQAVQGQYQIAQDYFLFIGTLEPRKNLRRLWDAWALAQADLPGVELVLVGSPGQVFRPAGIHLLPARTRMIGYIPDEHLPALYSGALALILPSLYEGFGFTALEAMACSTPVIAAHIPALLELAGDAACFVDPMNVESIAEGILSIFHEPAKRRCLSEQGLLRAQSYSWQAPTQMVQDVLSRL